MSTIIHKEKFLISFDTSKTYPDNWEGEDWLPVPTELESKLLSWFPDCKFIFNGDRTSLVDVEKIDAQLEADPVHYPSKLESLFTVIKSLTPVYISSLDIDEKLQASALIEDWVPGNYKIGDLANIEYQTWECHQAHNNSEHPDITPENPQTWATFWKPLHGTTPRTARKWVKPQYGTTDMYHIGEYMWYTDCKLYKCIQDTNFSPDEYAGAWELQDNL